jgi:hypothetical protein
MIVSVNDLGQLCIAIKPKLILETIMKSTFKILSLFGPVDHHCS